MDIGNIILLLSIVQAVLLLIVFWTKQKVKIPILPLTLLLFGLLYFQLEFLLVRNAAHLPSNILLLTPHGGWLMMGPLLYFFTKNLYEKRPLRQLLFHLIPFVVIAVILPSFLAEAVPKRGFDYGMLSVFTYRQLGLSVYNSIYGIIFFLQFIHLGVYILLSYRYNQQHAVWEYSQFIKRLLGITVLAYAACLFFYAILLGSTYYSREWDYFLILPTTIFVYFLSYFFLSKPELWRSDIKLKKDTKYERSALSSTEIEGIMKDVDTCLRLKKVFIDPELSLDTLSQSLGVSRHKLSQTINSAKGISFNDYINQYRITEAQKLLLENGTEKSILSIAYEVGFNNKATFNKYFKKFTGQTPSAFKKVGK